MDNKKRLISLTVASAMFLSAPLSAFAAKGDIINTGNKVIYRMSEANQEIIDKLIEDILDFEDTDNFLVEDEDEKYLDPQEELNAKRNVIKNALGENNVDLEDINAIIGYVTENYADIEAKQDEAVNNLDKKEINIDDYTDSEDEEEPGDDELVIDTVVAITEFVHKNGTLEFGINEETTAANLEEVEKAGYTVEFLASGKYLASDDDDAAVNKNNTGIVKANAGDTFKYQVKVSKDDELVAETELKEVTVQDQEKLVTAISAVELRVTQNELEVKIESGKLAEEDTAKVVVMGRTADMKASEEDAIITEKVTLSTDKPAIATVDNEGKIEQQVAKGDVTITAKAGELVKSITVNVGNEERAIDAENTTITPATLELVTGEKATIEVLAKDQYGDVWVIAENGLTTREVKNKEEKTIAEAVNSSNKGDKDGKATLEITAGDNAGTGNIVVSSDDIELGKVALTVKKAGDVAEYRLETDDKEYTLDLKTDNTKILTLTLNGYDKEGLATKDIVSEFGEQKDYSIKSSNEKIVTVNNKGEVTAVAVGTATITVYETADAFEEAVAEVEIEVINSTPSIKSVDTNKVDTVTQAVYGEGEGLDLNEIFTITAVNPEGKEIELAEFDEKDIKEKDSNVIIGQFAVIAIDKEDDIEIGELSNGKITIEGTGKGTLSISVVDTNQELKGSVIIEIDIPKED